MESLATLKLGNKMLDALQEAGALPAEVEARLQQQDLSTDIFYNGTDHHEHYVLGWLAKRSRATLPECLKQDIRLSHQSSYYELTLTESSPEVDLEYKLRFYQDLYEALYTKLQESFDKQIVVKVCFTEHRWLQEIGFGPYEEVGFEAASLCTIALTSVDAEAYHHFLKGDFIAGLENNNKGAGGI